MVEQAHEHGSQVKDVQSIEQLLKLAEMKSLRSELCLTLRNEKRSKYIKKWEIHEKPKNIWIEPAGKD